MNKKNKEISSLKNRIKFLEEEKSFLTSYLKTMATKAKAERKPTSGGDEYGDPASSNLATENRNQGDISSTQRGNRSLSAMRGKKANTKEPENIFSLSKLTGDETVDIKTGVGKLDEFLNELKEKDFEDKYAIMVDGELFPKHDCGL